MRHLISALCLCLSACSVTHAEAPTPPPDMPRPRLRVRVATVEQTAPPPLRPILGFSHPLRQATVAAEGQGRVLERHVRRGQMVRPGDLLFTLDGSRVALQRQQARAIRRSRATDLEHAQREARRAEALYEGRAVPEMRRDEAAHGLARARKAHDLALVSERQARRSGEDSRVLAPFEGQVVEFHLEAGDLASPGRPAVTLVDLSELRIRAGLTAAEARALERVGDTPVIVTFDELCVRREGRLTSVSPLPDSRTGTWTAELLVDNIDGALRAGLVAHVALPSPEGKALTIPREAVIRRGGRIQVFVVEGDTARRRAVVTGALGPRRVVVQEGLCADEVVVTEGHFALTDGALVEVGGSER